VTSRGRTLSLRNLLWRFFATGIVIFVILALNLLYQVDRIKSAASETRYEQARQELQQAFDQVERDGHHLLMRLAAWDEVEQQLRTPAYYSYWRKNRIEGSQKLPPYVRDLELYDADGKPLLQRGDRLLPAQRPIQAVYYRFHGGQLIEVRFQAVADRSDPRLILGHVGVAIDVLSAMLALQHFNHLQVDSLAILPFPGQLDDRDAVLQRMRFQPIAELESSPLEKLLKWNLLQFSLLLGAMVFLLYQLLRHYITRPLHELVAYLDGLRAGEITVNDSTPFAPPPIREFATLQESLHRYQLELDQVHMRLDTQNNELLRLVQHDHLTGVWNRRAFDDDWQHLVSIMENHRLSVAYLLFDCNHFKAINDTYGHETGDRVIAVIAEVLQQTLRRGDKLYRMGGDEFASVLINIDSDAVEQVAYRCQKAISVYPFNDLGIREPVSISIGIALTEETTRERLQSLPRQADLAMYNAKRQRRAVCFYMPEMGGDAAILSSNKVNTVLRAINHGDNIETHYQPIFRKDEEIPAYYEALVRLRDRHDELMFPGDIFPIIERHALDADLDRAMFRSIEADLASGLLPRHSGVSINLSAASLSDRHLERHLTALLPHLPYYRIVLEVTETSLISHLQVANANLEKLQRLGFYIALDDFGSGYSSLRYLANMPVDIVKFDITMIQALHESQRSRLIIEHVARLIREAGYDLVAEGIEDEATLDLVYRMGATHAQGYFLGKPQRAAGASAEGQGTGTAGMQEAERRRTPKPSGEETRATKSSFGA